MKWNDQLWRLPLNGFRLPGFRSRLERRSSISIPPTLRTYFTKYPKKNWIQQVVRFHRQAAGSRYSHTSLIIQSTGIQKPIVSPSLGIISREADVVRNWGFQVWACQNLAPRFPDIRNLTPDTLNLRTALLLPRGATFPELSIGKNIACYQSGTSLFKNWLKGSSSGSLFQTYSA